MSDIISMLKSGLSSQLLKGVSETMNEPEANVSKALNGIFPTLLSGLMNKADAPFSKDAMGQVVGLLENVTASGPQALEPSSLLGLLDGKSNGLAGTAKSFLSLIFGDKIQGIASFISKFAGIKESSASSLLTMATPMVLGGLGKKLQGSGLSIGNLTSSLMADKNSIIKSAPAGLGNLFGLSDLGSLGSKLTSSLANEAKEVKKKAAGFPIWPLILALLCLFGAFLLWKYFSRAPDLEMINEPVRIVQKKAQEAGNAVTEMAGNIADTVVDAAGNAADTVVDAAGNAADTVVDAAGNAADTVTGAAGGIVDDVKAWGIYLGEYFSHLLPNGVELKIPELGVEKRLLDFVGNTNLPIDKTSWFSFDRLQFDTGKAILQSKSTEQLSNIMEIMKAYPNVHIKIGGYTDNVGDTQANLTLSQKRAETVRNELITLGVDASRIEATGYGEEHPVASNDSDENRAKNRRIDVLITQK